MRKNYQIGNAQTIGSFEYQSNYFSTLELPGTAYGVLADGGIDHENGRKAAVIAVETSISAFRNNTYISDIPSFFDLLKSQVIRNINDRIYLGKTPHLSFTNVHIAKGVLNFYTVGENRLFVFDGKNILILSDIIGSTHLNKNDIVCLLSKGVYTALNEIELLSVLSRKGHLFDKAQQIIEAVNRKNKKNTENSTVLLIKGGL